MCLVVNDTAFTAQRSIRSERSESVAVGLRGPRMVRPWKPRHLAAGCDESRVVFVIVVS